jgi:hypothetical protein
MVPFYLLQNYHPTIPVIVYENGQKLSMKIFIKILFIFRHFSETHFLPCRWHRVQKMNKIEKFHPHRGIAGFGLDLSGEHALRW